MITRFGSVSAPRRRGSCNEGIRVLDTRIHGGCQQSVARIRAIRWPFAIGAVWACNSNCFDSPGFASHASKMKNMTRAAIVAASFLLVCSSNQAQTPEQESMLEDTAGRNKELVRHFYDEVFVEWNMALVDEVVSPGFRSHDWRPEHASGPKGFRDFYEGVRASFPDTRYVVDDLIAEGDRVVVRWRILATHGGEFFGIAATGRAITLKGIAIYRVEAGKLMERWVVFDLHGLLDQIQRPVYN
jgi:predicted ester cyclase